MIGTVPISQTRNSEAQSVPNITQPVSDGDAGTQRDTVAMKTHERGATGLDLEHNVQSEEQGAEGHVHDDIVYADESDTLAHRYVTVLGNVSM